MSGEGKIRLVEPRTERDWREARRLVEDYAASLGFDLSFQDFDRELDHLESEYSPPEGAFLMAEEQGAYVGCVGLRPFRPGTGEIKRLYVVPRARGSGIGRLLAEGIVARAGRIGYRRLVLDTLASMRTATSLYVSLGFKPIAPYRFNPVPGAVFLELELEGEERK